MKINYLSIIIALIAFYWGIHVIIEPVWYDSKYFAKIDVSEFKWFLGILFIFLGAIFLWSEMKKFFKNKTKE